MELGVVLSHATSVLEDAITSFRCLGNDLRPMHFTDTPLYLCRSKMEATGHGRGLRLTIPSKPQDLDKKLSRISLPPRESHNTIPTLVGALPDHVLSLVLEQACVIQAEPVSSPWNHSSVFYGFCTFSGPTARALSGVCRLWRSLLLSNPIVWSDVCMTVKSPENLKWLEICLTRSASSPAGCTIQIDQPGQIPEVEVTKVISSFPFNIRYLKIKPGTEKGCGFLVLKMKNLERLHVSADTNASGFTYIPTASHLTKLRAVILQNLPAVPHNVFFNITGLTLTNITFPVANLVDVFQANQTLEIVRINNTPVAEDLAGRTVSLPSLKLLCISHSSPLAVLRMLSPLPLTSRVIIHDHPTTLATSGISDVFHPSLIFGPNSPFLSASISMLLGEALVTFGTFTGATVEIIAQADPVGADHRSEFYLFLSALSEWKPFSDLDSLHLRIERGAVWPITLSLIRALLSRVPRITHLSFEGHALCFLIGQALNVMRSYGMICTKLNRLDGTLHPNDRITESIRSLSDALKIRPNIREVALYALLQEEKVEEVIAEVHPLMIEIESYGVNEVSFTPTIDQQE